MSRKRRSHVNDFVEPDLPITPMLDMSFQLLAFFIMTFHPAPTEGQIAMSLPPPDVGGPSSGIPNPADDKPVKFIVRISVTDTGTIAGMNIREDGSADEKGNDIGADVGGRLLPELKKLYEGLTKQSKQGKLTLEIGDKLLQDYVVQIMDATVQSGFTDISPVPIDPKKR